MRTLSPSDNGRLGGHRGGLIRGAVREDKSDLLSNPLVSTLRVGTRDLTIQLGERRGVSPPVLRRSKHFAVPAG